MVSEILKKIIHRLKRIGRRLISPAIYRLFEKKEMKVHNSLTAKYEPLFIVGAPRTGSTILYQVLTNEFKVKYFDNIVSKWYNNILYGFRLSQSEFGDNPHNCFKSNLGSTDRFSKHAPSECGDFWYRWVTKEKDFVDFDELGLEDQDEMRMQIYAVINKYNQPLIIKNLNNGQRLRMLSQIFPKARIIYIKRDIIESALSIIKAKKKLGLYNKMYWSVKPPNIDKIKNLPEHQQVLSQIIGINEQISMDLKLFEKKNVFEVDYEELKNSLTNVMDKFEKLYSGLVRRESALIPEVKNTKLSKEDSKEIEMLNTALKKLNYAG